jgi:hypothetical protein
MLQIVDYSTTEAELFEQLAEAEEVTETELKDNYCSISKATKQLGFKYSQYTRRLLLQGKLAGIKVAEQHYQKWYINNDSIDRYMNNHRRTEQLRRFILRADLEQQAAIRSALDELGIEYELELAYQSDK